MNGKAVAAGEIDGFVKVIFDAKTGAAKDFVSGYGAAVLPNPWDRSAAVRSQIR